MACGRLGRKKLTAVVPAAVTGKGVNRIMCAGERGGETYEFRREDGERSRLYRLRDRIVLAEDRDVAAEMRERGLVALVPLRGPGGKQGSLPVGEKSNRFSLDPMDLDFLDQLAARIGFFFENHLLSLHLMDRVEELSEAKLMLEESDRFKSEIISITSHEFRIPLSVINGFAIILRNYFPRLSEEERGEILDHIVNSCHRLDSLLEKFLTVSSLRDGKVAIDMSPCSVETAFNEACYALPDDARGRVRVVLRGNGLILKNLLDNARRFSDDHSPITLFAEEREEHIEVEVRDEGEGIDPELSEVIFEPFTRLEELDKHAEGMGLGLYIVRLAADLIGTRVTVESRSGGGAAFRFALPKA